VAIFNERFCRIMCRGIVAHLFRPSKLWRKGQICQITWHASLRTSHQERHHFLPDNMAAWHKGSVLSRTLQITEGYSFGSYGLGGLSDTMRSSASCGSVVPVSIIKLWRNRNLLVAMTASGVTSMPCSASSCCTLRLMS
jgi:hypothetical protein